MFGGWREVLSGLAVCRRPAFQQVGGWYVGPESGGRVNPETGAAWQC
jgi:hypothetical protein